MIDPTKWKTAPLPHQTDGVRWIVEPQPGRQADVSALFDVMGSGKSKQVVDAACELYQAGEINTVVIFCPAAVRFGWADLELGQIATHGWVPSTCQVLKSVDDFVPNLRKEDGLSWVAISYEWARSKTGLEKLWLELTGRKIFWIVDESHRLQTHNSTTTKELTKLHDELGGRAVELSGTPMGNRYILSLWGQMRFLSKKILPYENFYHYRARYCQMGGFQNKKVVKYFDTDQLTRLLKPYVLRRTNVKLPMKTYKVFEVPLSNETWKTYKQLRDDAVALLSEQPQDRLLTTNAMVQLLRLTQLTSGLIGGLDGEHARLISTEKQDWLLNWLDELREQEESARVVVWCRWRDEVPRLSYALNQTHIKNMKLVGGQSERERETTLRELKEGFGDVVVIGQPQAGGSGVNAPTFRRQVFLSHVEALLDRQQAEDRLVRTDSTFAGVEVIDVLATGPQGQQTVDHKIYRNVRAGISMHTMTMAQWRSALKD